MSLLAPHRPTPPEEQRPALPEQPIAMAEFLVIDTETNGLAGDSCELTEVGAVLVGGGELHDRWDTLVRTNMPLGRGIQRFTGITQQMVDSAPAPDDVLPQLETRLAGRVMVAHNAAFDRRVLRQAFERIGLDWPNPPVLCTAALARTMLPLQRERRLGALAKALDIEVEQAHRALADAETCARVLCALFPKLCANAATIADAVALLRPKRRKTPYRSRRLLENAQARLPQLEFKDLPKDPGVYLFRDSAGATLYVGKSISIRNRARAHFAPSAPKADWAPHATAVDYRATKSELGALVLENRLIKELRPPGNIRLRKRDDRLVYIRCRLDIPFPILEVHPEPAAGHAVTIGPLGGRRAALELVEQLDSLFGLRHCGRRLERRDHPSAYGQMGRCLSPCLGDLDPNLYRHRLDEALSVFLGAGDSGQKLIDHVHRQMRDAAAGQLYERAASLRRRARRLTAILERLDGLLEATHARPRLVLAAHPTDSAADAFWIAGGRLVDWGALPADPAELERRTHAALIRGGRPERTAHVPPDEIDELRILGAWLASHPGVPQLSLDPPPDRDALTRFASAERQLDDGRADLVLTHGHGRSHRRLAAHERERDRAETW
ncbi:MAG TPA: exonuclease domain-containing protein [Solirubrobacteraceae bacterium]|nr:exonuclease domain-containing protein [Solirubrobacteraceae bacterium]